MNAILLASAGLVILLVGGGFGFWVGRSGVGGGKARVEKAEAELDEYKRNVTEHFGQTAAHFQAIGKQYRELYAHMATGAQALCEPDEAGKRLEFAPGANAALTNPDDPAAEGAADDEVRPPIDYAEQPIAPEEAKASDAPTDEQPGEKDAKAENAKSDGVGSPASETAAEQEPETKADSGERTLH